MVDINRESLVNFIKDLTPKDSELSYYDVKSKTIKWDTKKLRELGKWELIETYSKHR